MATLKPHWVFIYKPLSLKQGYRYGARDNEPHSDSLPGSLVCLIVIPEAYSHHDAIARAMLGYGTVVVGGRNKSEVVVADV